MKVRNIKLKFLVFIIISAFTHHTFAQHLQIDTLFLFRNEKAGALDNQKLKFPIVISGHKKIDALINADIKNRFTNNEFTGLPADSTIIKWAGDQIIFLDFEVTYLKNGLLSLNISAEGCAAYCTGWTDYFTYSLKTGKHLSVNDIIDTTGEFRNMVFAEKDKQYDEQRAELKKLSSDPNSGLDDDTYKWVLEQYNSCDASFTLSSFALYPDRIEVIDNCSLPNAIKVFDPEIRLVYKYDDLRKLGWKRVL